MLPTKLAFVDLETTGARTSYDRIIEIGIVLTDDNKVVETYSSLINPQTHIPPTIERITGISPRDVENAPTFREIANDIRIRLEGRIFVAHNVRFDYGFLKSEFHRQNISFTSKHFCTVRLSRLLYPAASHHNLDSIIQRMNLVCVNRHRALDDAKATFSFYQKAQEEHSPEVFTQAMKQVLRKPYLPIKLEEKILENLPESPGVYLFFGGDGTPLYIGKSINIKDRVLSHFSGDIHSPLEMKIAQQVESIETIPTAGELGALFLESELIKKMLPLYNRMLRRKKELVTLRQVTDSNGYHSIVMETLTSLPITDLTSFLGFFRSKKQAKDYLTFLAKEHTLCKKLLGLEKTSASCFGYRLDRCLGACTGKELPMKYNLRFLTAFTKTKVRPWPFDGAIIIEEKNELQDRTEYFLIDKWCYLGSVTLDAYGSYKEEKRPYSFDLDMYKILKRYIFTAKNENNIRSASRMQQSLSL